MGKKRGFFAEMQHQAAVAERNRQRAQAVAVREQSKAVREAERAHNAAQRARVAANRADAKAAVDAEREAKRLYVAAQESKVASMNADLQMALSEIDGILEATLKIDDFVDLEKLRKVAIHPDFESRHQQPTPIPAPIDAPREPTWIDRSDPQGLFEWIRRYGIGTALFGRKQHAEAVEVARQEFQEEHRRWQATVASIPMRQLEQLTKYKAAEDERLRKLAADQAKYDEACRQRQAEVDAANAELDTLIRNFKAGEQEAVSDYIGIVFGNSVYADDFPWAVEYEYDQSTRELRVDLEFPSPNQLPTARQYKYVKARDEITETAQTQKEQRDRYTGMVHNMVLRTLHEVWESDRDGRVDSISLAGGVEHIDPATGQQTFTPLIAVAVGRQTFSEIDLSRVTPAETLKHLNAVVSKNPHALQGIDTSAGVRGH